jgi:class 3 adenylate cyclase
VKPETRYARLGDDHIAYQVVGDGEIDLLLTLGSFGHVDAWWDFPPVAHFLNGLASFSRVILLDRRGFGASDPLPDDRLGDWDAWADELVAVLDAAGSERAALFAEAQGIVPALTFAVREPGRVLALIIGNASAGSPLDQDGGPGVTPDAFEGVMEQLIETWGTDRAGLMFNPDKAADTHFMRQFARYTRAITGPRRAADAIRAATSWDGRPLLPLVKAPTLVIHRREMPLVPIEAGRYIAEHIEGARMLELPGYGALMGNDDADEVLEEVRGFLTGVPGRPRGGRALATLAFTDIVGSTARAAALGDSRWASLLATHNQVSRQYIDQFGGRLLKDTGDGSLATFDSPGRAINCMRELGAALERHGLDIRVGIHTGEVDVGEVDVGGLGVHIASRIVEVAAAGEIVVSGTVRDLVTGSRFAFADRGSHEFKGVPGEWRLFTVTQG